MRQGQCVPAAGRQECDAYHVGRDAAVQGKRALLARDCCKRVPHAAVARVACVDVLDLEEGDGGCEQG